jgi:CRP-like cAMP-binding protein
VTRDFFVVLDGVATVERDGARAAELSAGDFFGELAAHDWGRGYGYVRTATVIATTDLAMLVFAEGALGTLTRLSPSLATAVDAAMATRLPG